MDGDIRYLSHQPHSSMLSFFDNEIQWTLEECLGEILQLAKGEVIFEGEECLIKTGQCFDLATKEVYAVSFPDVKLWNGPRTKSYLGTNEEALRRQVPVTRYFVLSDSFLSDPCEVDQFVTGMRRHLALQKETSVKKAKYYNIKIVLENSVNLSTNEKGRPDIPDVSYFDGVVVSEWGPHPSSPNVSYSKLSLAIGNWKKRIDTVFAALENSPARSIKNESELRTFLT